MTRSSFESPLMPREIADAPDIENVPVSDWMNTLSQTVMDMHQMLREIRDGLATQPDPDGGVEMTTAEWEGFTGSGAQNATQGSASPLPGIPGGPEGATGAPGGAGEVGLGDAIRANLVARPYRGPGLGLRALADRADELEAAYRVADTEIARLSEFHDHYRGQVERVRALLKAGHGSYTRTEIVEALDGTQ